MKIRLQNILKPIMYVVDLCETAENCHLSYLRHYCKVCYLLARLAEKVSHNVILGQKGLNFSYLINNFPLELETVKETRKN